MAVAPEGLALFFRVQRTLLNTVRAGVSKHCLETMKEGARCSRGFA